MSKSKVIVTRVGKRISWRSMNLSSPCKFYIESKDKTHIEVLFKTIGLSKKDYKIVEAKNQKDSLKNANKKAEIRAEATAKKVSEGIKKQDVEVKSEVKKEEPKPEVKKEEPKVEVKKHDHKNNKKK